MANRRSPTERQRDRCKPSKGGVKCESLANVARKQRGAFPDNFIGMGEWNGIDCAADDPGPTSITWSRLSAGSNSACRILDLRAPTDERLGTRSTRGRAAALGPSHV